MKKLVCSTFLAAALLLPLARAGTLGLDTTCTFATCGGGQATYSSSLGWQFIVNSPIWVDALAFYDYNNADTLSHAVGIYNDSTQALLVSTTVTTADPKIGSGPWLVQSVTPVLLGVGMYDIMAVTGSPVAGEDYYAWKAALPPPAVYTTNASISYVQAEFYGSPTFALTFPNSSNPVIQGFFGPSFMIGQDDVDNPPAPEPASFLLLGSGLLLAAGLRHRRARAR